MPAIRTWNVAAMKTAQAFDTLSWTRPHSLPGNGHEPTATLHRLTSRLRLVFPILQRALRIARQGSNQRKPALISSSPAQIVHCEKCRRRGFRCAGEPSSDTRKLIEIWLQN